MRFRRAEIIIAVVSKSSRLSMLMLYCVTIREIDTFNIL
jgi:hypothetical protein